MELKRLDIINFMGIGEGSVDFNRGSGITLIKGENHDSPSSVSNGAGKSSIFEALFWVLYGKTKRGLTGDAVINEVAKKDCCVALRFDDYQLTRTRKPNQLTLLQDDGSGTYPTDLTKGTMKETQVLVDEIIKISELTFSKIAYFGQEDVKAFASLSDAELKNVFEQALGLTFLSEHQAKAKAHMTATKAKLETAQQTSAQMTMQITEAQEKIAILNKAASDLRARREAEQLRILADIGQHEVGLEAVKQQYIQTQAKAKQSKAELDVLTTKLNELREYGKKLASESNDQFRQQSEAKAGLRGIERTLVEMKNRVGNLPNMVGQACETCKRPFSEADIKNAINAVKEQMKARLLEYQFYTERAASIKIKVDQINEVATKLQQAIDAQQSVVNETLATTNPKVIYHELSELERRANELNRKIEEGQTILSKLANEDASYAKEIQDKKDWIDDREMEKALADREIATLQAEFDTVEMLVEVLGNAGMKSYVFDNVTPALNSEINKFARMLDDITVEVSTVKPLKSGEFREKFHIKVENEHGSSEYSGNSGGEKQKVNLAVAMGFNKVFRAMSQGAVNAVFLDEPFESLDKGSSEAVIELCKAFNDVGNVFVITHQDAIKDLITDVINVEKKGKKAVIC